MKIKSYPGFAIEAGDSEDKHGSMGLLYEANWMNANEQIRQTPLTAYSKSHVNVSALGQYQEQIRALEAGRKVEATRSFRDFNGYKPSTLKLKKNTRSHNEWDNEPKQQPKDVIHNPLYNHAQNNWHSSDYLTNKRADPKLRRSQTVIVKQPTSAVADRFENASSGEFDIRDFYRRRHQLRQLEESHGNKFASGLSVHLGASDCADRNGIPKNCDSVSDNNDSLYRDCSANLSALSRNNRNDTVNDASANRMNCYKTSNYFAHSPNSVSASENGEIESVGNGKAGAKILLNPLARNKSIKINHFDMVASAKEPQKLKPEEIDGQLCDTNGKSGQKVKKNSFSRIFATISAGSKFPRVFLGRSGRNQRAKLNLEALSENAESQQSNSSLSTLSTSPVYPSSPSQTERIVQSNRKHGSSSSSDSDSFAIPRPRLIVPVHTYARQRRTGNLTDQSNSNSKGCDRNKGKRLNCAKFLRQ